MKLLLCLFGFLLCLISLTGNAQEVLLNEEDHRFLIDAKSNRPRLDVIVQKLTPYAKREVSKYAVIDTVTRPTYQLHAPNECTVTASRMGERLFFVIRGAEQLEPGYQIDYRYGNLDRQAASEEDAVKYNLNGLLCWEYEKIPFGVEGVTIRLADRGKQTIYTMHVKFNYLSPQLHYVGIVPPKDEYWMNPDSLQKQSLIGQYNQVATNYLSESAVPERIVMAELSLYFGFKPIYYDGKVHPVNVFTMLDGVRTVTESKTIPVQVISQKGSIWEWLKNGDHRLEYSYTSQPGGAYNFEIRHGWIAGTIHVLIAVLWMIGMVLFSKPALLALLCGLFAYLLFKRRLRGAQIAEKKASLELKSVKAQLNPHFVFNALGSVQSLINQNDVEKANTYLTDFSKLLRGSLVNQDKEHVSLSEELRLLETYIRLEQLRSHFSYQMIVGPGVEADLIEIPFMLIQPVVENAIKHGIGAIGESGRLVISVRKVEHALVLEVQDNGPGHCGVHASDGQGLKITRERIALMNRKRKQVAMTFREGGGTLVTFTFNRIF